MNRPPSPPPASERADAPDTGRGDSVSVERAEWVARMSRACAGGDRAALDAVHNRFAPGVRALFTRRAGPARADTIDDLCQRTWMMTWEAISARTYDPSRAAISTFVYAVANTVWMRHLRSVGAEARRGVTGRLDESTEVGSSLRPGARAGGASPPVEDDPASAAGLAEDLQAMRAALVATGSIDALTPDEREVIRGASRGESDRDLARRLGFAASTINGKKQSALDKLRRLLSRPRGAPTTAHAETNA